MKNPYDQMKSNRAFNTSVAPDQVLMALVYDRVENQITFVEYSRSSELELINVMNTQVRMTRFVLHKTYVFKKGNNQFPKWDIAGDGIHYTPAEYWANKNALYERLLPKWKRKATDWRKRYNEEVDKNILPVDFDYFGPNPSNYDYLKTEPRDLQYHI